MRKLIGPMLVLAVMMGALVVGLQGVSASVVKKPHKEVCSHQKDEFSCHARVITDEKGKPDVTVSPYGLGPVQLQNAYGVATASAVNRTIAIVDAYNDPN